MEQDLFPGARRSSGVTLGPRALVLLIAVAAMTAGCGAAGTIPARTAQDDCERWGGIWRPRPALCEFQSDGGAM